MARGCRRPQARSVSGHVQSHVLHDSHVWGHVLHDSHVWGHVLGYMQDHDICAGHVVVLGTGKFIGHWGVASDLGCGQHCFKSICT